MGLSWYDELREKYRPETLDVLLIGESPPDPGEGERRFFYAPELSQHDNLYRGVATALYSDEFDLELRDKPQVLRRLQDDGFWLIDAVETPMNRETNAKRRAQVRAAAARMVERCVELSPRRGVMICHGVVYELCASTLRSSGVHVLHDEPLPFPLGNWRAKFIEGFRTAVLKA